MNLNSVTLAFLGDAFYELSVRRRLTLLSGSAGADKLHLMAVHYVNAAAQSAAVRGLAERGILTDEEQDVVRKARNHKPKSFPKNASPLDYKLASAFEALLGYHYISGRHDRAEELAGFAMSMIEEKHGKYR